ncbi:MAG: hypothetical protein H8E62_07945, partial [Planctomycetes bacterium]|nr:hypothetical protein [Planctomycetota bacterium]
MFCHIIQWRIEKQLDDTGQVSSPGLLKHLDACPACRNWRDSLMHLQQQLQTTSPHIPDSDMQRILAAMQHSLSTIPSSEIAETAPATHRLYRFRLAVGAAAAVIAVALGLFSVYNRPQPDSGNYHVAIAPVTQLPRQLQDQVSALVDLSDQMIESEIKKTEQDIRRSVGFIQNCLP